MGLRLGGRHFAEFAEILQSLRHIERRRVLGGKARHTARRGQDEENWEEEASGGEHKKPIYASGTAARQARNTRSCARRIPAASRVVASS